MSELAQGVKGPFSKTMSDRYLIEFDLKNIKVVETDFLVIGGGIAGLTAALLGAKKLNVTVLNKGVLNQSSTWYAQGGIAAPLASGDPELHYKDTIEAGAGLCDPEAVKVLVTEAQPAIDLLLNLGISFDKEGDFPRLSREGGHSAARVLHVGDTTGSAIALSLAQGIKENSRITLAENHFVLDLLVVEDRCWGALSFDGQGLVACLAPATLLATGGMGQLYEVTTNPLMATGDGQAIAWRAGAKLRDLEFVQFHPSALVTSKNPRFLISEAIRGEGAYLRDNRGRRFMLGVHPLVELAPRDVITRKMFEVMKETGEDHVYLDARHLSKENVKSRFPEIWRQCQKEGYNLGEDLIPVAPAAHYMIGGVETDLYGKTSLPGLFASGEVACTGVHGANRLASNSLLEGLVFSRRVSQYLLENLNLGERLPIACKEISFYGKKAPHLKDLTAIRVDLRRLMTEKVGIVRSVAQLEEAQRQIKEWQRVLEEEYQNPHDWETQNMLLLASLIVEAALSRSSSCGVHQMQK